MLIQHTYDFRDNKTALTAFYNAKAHPAQFFYGVSHFALLSGILYTRQHPHESFHMWYAPRLFSSIIPLSLFCLHFVIHAYGLGFSHKNELSKKV
ncbi:MAG: hypothetical protein ACI4JQ_03255 [Ruminococcus sp.]